MAIKISACIIGKNEEHNLPRLLNSLEGFADEIIYVDTGSTDRSKEIARSYGAKISDFVWRDDFAAARNAALARASGDYIFNLDCDEELPREEGLKLRMFLNNSPEVDVVGMVNHDVANESYHNRILLWKNGLGIKYTYPIHEQVKLPEGRQLKSMLSDVKILHYGYDENAKKRKKQFRRDREIIQKMHETDPADEFFAYYAAQNAQIDGNKDKALAIMNQLVSLNGKLEFAISYRLMGSILSSHKAHQEAISVLTEGLGKFPEFADLTYVLGNVYFGSGDLQKAIECYQKCLNMPTTGLLLDNWGGATTYLPLRGMAMCYFTLGKVDRAIEALTESVRLSGNNRVSLGMLESAFIRMFGETQGQVRLEEHLKAQGITNK